MLPGKIWEILNQDANRSIIDVILENRDLPASHLDPFKLSDRIYSPYLLPDIKKGIERILEAIHREEKIIIFGDYDVDGITSTALMVYFFRKINYPIEYILPHREKDGYGLRKSSVDQIAKMKADLIITVDNGISSNDAIEYANWLGIDTVITDHHLQEGDLPNAVAVINPNRIDSLYPFKTICGAVVAFKVIYALCEEFMDENNMKQFLLNHLDLVAIGTIADVMPLRDENYALVKFGLKTLSNTRKPGLIELKKISGINEKNVTPVSVGFFLSPRLNASGRLERATKSVELLVTESPEEAHQISAYLDKLNRKRQILSADYLNYALDAIPDDKTDLPKVIFIENETWQAGLIGLVSGQLKERYSRPVFAFTKDENGNYVGSARSISEFHIINALTQFSHYFINYGGHQKAAGLTVSADKYNQFKQEFIQYADQVLDEKDLIPKLTIDSVIDIDQINLNTARAIIDIGPFGETNQEPVLLIRDVLIKDIILLSRDKHLKLYVQKGNQLFECVWWNSGIYKDELTFGAKMDIAFKLNINNWQGTDRLQLTIEDLKYSNRPTQ
jgi:single-stranded-DNA-specific exonuclease